MRLFIRVETTFVVTLDIPDTSSIKDLKVSLWESKQTKIQIENMCLFRECHLLKDDEVIKDAMQIGGVRFPYLVLQALQYDSDYPILKDKVFPHNDQTDVLLSTAMTIPLAPQVAHVTNGFIECRTCKDQRCSGEMMYEEGSSIVRFTPTNPLLPNTTLTFFCYINGDYAISKDKDIKFRNDMWSFKTLNLSPIRITVINKSSNNIKYITLERNSMDLFGELRNMCSITATNDIVQFEIDESASAEKSCYDHEDVPLLDFEEYKRQHWVNEEAGYYAVVGKMTAEEELEAILNVYEAFKDAK